jgi:hypothetical protein
MPNHTKSTLRSESIGLDPDKIDERKIEERLYRFVAMKNMDGMPAEQAPVPKGTLDKAGALRKAILQMSLAPDIYMNKSLKIKSPSCVG